VTLRLSFRPSTGVVALESVSKDCSVATTVLGTRPESTMSSAEWRESRERSRPLGPVQGVDVQTPCKGTQRHGASPDGTWKPVPG